jgi:predicted GIY-YIG superfamily endonuclease
MTKDRYYMGTVKGQIRRLAQHNADVTKSTNPYRPWLLVDKEHFLNTSEGRFSEKRKKIGRTRITWSELLALGN